MLLLSEFDMIFRHSDADALFSTEARWSAMLRFEAALARAEADCGVIPETAVTPIRQACSLDLLDAAAILASCKRSGNVAIPLIKELTNAVARIDANAAAFVHWGATSQDVIDTALVLQLEQYFTQLDALLIRFCNTLGTLVVEHRTTVMPGRTLLQQAVPITFGLKVATWLDAILRHCERLQELMPRLLVLQFGGAAGTLASLGDNGQQVANALAKELSLRLPALPWHTQRDRLAEVCTFHGLLMGTLGKIARDLSLCMQSEIAELSEPVQEGRGSSSTMPHKRNPVAAAVVLAASLRTPGLVATALAAMVQEHERALGGWHAEWEVVPEICLLTFGALATLFEVLDSLQVDSAAMQNNLDVTHGLLLAEAVSMALAPSLGRSTAQAVVTDACQRALTQNLSLREAIDQDPRITAHLTAEQRDTLLSPAMYLGDASGMIDRVLDSWKQSRKQHKTNARPTR